jgi:hypothetical protein
MGENKRTVFIRQWAGGGLDTRLNGRAEVESGTRPGAGVPRPTIVTEELALSAIEYDSFLSSPLGRRSWLKGRGGWDKNGVRRAIALKCPGRITLYVDPSGYDYGRYVGVKV